MKEGRIVADLSPNELLKSDLLKECGIREPLYLTAMKYAGCDINSINNLCDLDNIDIDDDNKKKLKEFFDSSSDSQEVNKNETLIKFDHVSFSYGELKALDDVSFEMKKGERIAIIGKNGAGKSTAAKLMCGLIRPQEGTVYLDNEDIRDFSIKEIGERVGYVMQNPNQMLVKDIIKDEVSLALDLRNMPVEEIEDRVKNVLEACRLYSMRNWPVDSISYGQKKRVTVASIMALQPEILILDEPTAGQDFHSYTDIMNFVNELNKEYEKTIIFITHDMHLAIENTERAIVFADGKLINDDKVFAVLSNNDTITKAHLKQTSLYYLAQKVGSEPYCAIRSFIEYERKVVNNE